MVDLITQFLHLAQAGEPPAPPSAANGLMQFLPFILLFAGMWFLLIAPQRKKQKEHDAMIKALQRGDKVMTSGGIFGEITSVKDDRVTVKIAENTKVEMNRSFISSKISSGS